MAPDFPLLLGAAVTVGIPAVAIISRRWPPPRAGLYGRRCAACGHLTAPHFAVFRILRRISCRTKSW